MLVWVSWCSGRQCREDGVLNWTEYNTAQQQSEPSRGFPPPLVTGVRALAKSAVIQRQQSRLQLNGKWSGHNTPGSAVVPQECGRQNSMYRCSVSEQTVAAVFSGWRRCGRTPSGSDPVSSLLCVMEGA